MPKIAELRGDEDIERVEICRFLGGFDRCGMRLKKGSNQWNGTGPANGCSSLTYRQKAEISLFLGGFDRSCMRLKKESNRRKCMGLVTNACSSLASVSICLKGITIDASIWTKESAVSCRVGLYKLRRPGKELKNYFYQNIDMIKGKGFVWEDCLGSFMQNFSQDTEMAVIDYGEIEIVKEEILDLKCGGATSDNQRIKWDILINGGDGEIVYHDEEGFPTDALYMFSYHLNWNAKSWIYYGSMMYYNVVI